MEVIKDDYIRKIEAVKILQKAYAEGRIKAKDGCVSVLDDINALPKADVQTVRRGKLRDTVADLCEAKRLLKLAIEDFSNIYDHIFDCGGMCDTCPLHGERDHCLKWRYADEAEKLLNE